MSLKFKKVSNNKIIDNYLKLHWIFSNNNEMLIDNYNQIIEITDNHITIDFLLINGKDLKIVSLDDYRINIKGLIYGVMYLDEKI